MATGLYIAIDFKPNLGGIAEHTHQMAKHLTELGEQITVITPQLPGSEEFDETCNYQVIRYGFISKQYSKSKFRLNSLLLLKEILLFILKSRPSYLICDRWDAITGIVLSLVSLMSGLPFFLFAHGNEFSQPVRWSIFRKITVRRASKVICVSNYIRSLVLIDDNDSQKAITIYSGFDYREIEQYQKGKSQKRFSSSDLNFPANTPIILTVSRLLIRKGIDQVIKAMPYIVSEVPEAKYVIVGDGQDRKILEDIASESPVRENIMFLGSLIGYEKFNWYARCDIFVMPSRYYEGSPLVFPEANAFGKPVIGGTFGGQSDAVANGKTGLLVNPYDTEEISKAIIRLLQNPDEAHELGNNGRQRIRDELNWNTSASNFLSVVRDTIMEFK